MENGPYDGLPIPITGLIHNKLNMQPTIIFTDVFAIEH